MDWNKTKSMFIFVFLILDIFLLVQFSRQFEESKIERLKDPSLEEKLENNNIKYSGLPTETLRSQYVSAKVKKFTEKDIKELTEQDITIGPNKTTLKSKFKKPIKIKSGNDHDHVLMENILKERILFGDQYKYWKYDKDKKEIVFYQVYENKVFFKNKNGHVILHLNDKNEIESYEQTFLENAEKRREENVLPAITAIGNLLDKNLIMQDSDIKVDLGYYTLIQQTESQVLVPTWHLIVEHDKKKEDLYVNAIEGRVIPKDDKENESLE